MGEGKSVIGFANLLPLYRVGSVLNVCASSVPPCFLILSLLVAVHRYFHSIVEQRVRFCLNFITNMGIYIVKDVEPDFLTFLGILYSKVKPLCVTICIYIILHE